jgi:hypothetical protein
MSSQILRGLLPLSPFYMTSDLFRFVSCLHLNRPLRLRQAGPSVIELRMTGASLSSLPKFANLPCWRNDSVEMKHTKVTYILLIGV